MFLSLIEVCKERSGDVVEERGKCSPSAACKVHLHPLSCHIARASSSPATSPKSASYKKAFLPPIPRYFLKGAYMPKFARNVSDNVIYLFGSYENKNIFFSSRHLLHQHSSSSSSMSSNSLNTLNPEDQQ